MPSDTRQETKSLEVMSQSESGDESSSSSSTAFSSDSSDENVLEDEHKCEKADEIAIHLLTRRGPYQLALEAMRWLS